MNSHILLFRGREKNSLKREEKRNIIPASFKLIQAKFKKP